MSFLDRPKNGNEGLRWSKSEQDIHQRSDFVQAVQQTDRLELSPSPDPEDSTRA